MTLNQFFRKAENYLPMLIWLLLWLLVLPVRLLVLLMLPISAQYTWHPLQRLHSFFVFDN